MVASYGTMARAYGRSGMALRKRAGVRRRPRLARRTRTRAGSRLARGSRAAGKRRQGRIYPRRRAPVKRRQATRNFGDSITYMRKSFGKTKRLTFKKLDNKGTLNYIYRMQGVNRQNTATVTRDPVTGFVTAVTTPGFYTLNYRREATFFDAPIHLWCLNGKNNSTANIALLLRPNNSGNPTWTNITNSQQANGTLIGNTQFKIEYQNSAALIAEETQRYNRHKWYDIRMNLYGTVTNTVTYDIYLCKFMIDEINPFSDTYKSDDSRTHEFWTGQYQSVVYNTLMPRPYGGDRGFMVLKHKRCVIEASNNDELDIAPQCVQLKWFYRDGRIYDYMENAKKALGTQIADGGWAERGTLSSAEMTNFPQPRAQLFLMVKASNTGDDLIDSIEAKPSYDLIIRRASQIFL